MTAVTIRFDNLQNQIILSKDEVMHYTTAMDIIEKKLIDSKMIDETKEVSYTIITDEEEMSNFFFAVGIGSIKHWIDEEHINAVITFTAVDNNQHVQEYYILYARPTARSDVHDWIIDLFKEREINYIEV